MKKKHILFRLLTIVFMLLMVLALAAGCGKNVSAGALTAAAESFQAAPDEKSVSKAAQSDIKEDGEYSSKEEVASYIHKFGKLPSNYITKDEAKALGWNSKEGNLWDVAPGKSIGGDYFGNREGLLPEKEGRDYYECDVNYKGGYRSSERIIYSNDGLIYYTEDHYETFELLYGEE
ncbi:MAG: ribonuclease [Eubacterium sp.]|nr:ribonuclease [Eubacterium sp.]